MICEHNKNVKYIYSLDGILVTLPQLKFKKRVKRAPTLEEIKDYTR